MLYLAWVLLKFGVWCYAMSFSTFVAGLAAPLAGVAGMVRGLTEVSAASMTVYRDSATVPELDIREPPAEPGSDPAYQGYFYGQVYRDYWFFVTRSTIRCAEATRLWVERVVRRWLGLERFAVRSLTFFPVTGVCLGLVAGAVAAGICLALISVVYLVVLALVSALVMAGGGLLWLLESSLLTVRGVTLECGTCHERVSRPVYVCSGTAGCNAEHSRLLPGRQGVFWRLCRCERVLPTLLLLGKNALLAKCCRCGAELPLDSLSAPTVHIPVAGGPSVGKSVFMFAAVSRLHDDWSGRDPAVRQHFWADERFARIFADNREALADPTLRRKTTEARPRAYTVYVGERRAGRRLVYLYDSAGEGQLTADDLAGGRFYRFTKGLVVCIDPFSMGGVRRTVRRQVLDDVRSRAEDPRRAIDAQVENLRENLGPKGPGPIPVAVAVVLTKADAFAPAGVRHPYQGGDLDVQDRTGRSAAVEAWLDQVAGRPDIAASLQLAFERVSFFVTSYAGAGPGPRASSLDDDPEAPLRWILLGR